MNPRPWKIVNQSGDTVVTAQSIMSVARMLRMDPKRLAERDAADMADPETGETFFAVRAFGLVE